MVHTVVQTTQRPLVNDSINTVVRMCCSLVYSSPVLSGRSLDLIVGFRVVTEVVGNVLEPGEGRRWK